MLTLGGLYIEPNIILYGSKLEIIHVFVYFSSVLFRAGTLDAEIHQYIDKGTYVFGRLKGKVWSGWGIIINMKLSIYKSCVHAT